ncbi:hypothetical protein [Pseudidiomarina gelatinasegens]|uniref:hypothetical protein n=1 Tax=Pseudidiomarina gelatinasegens TaxID=2487740 RepID=UPI003A987CEA
MGKSYSRSDLREQLETLSLTLKDVNRRKFQGDVFGDDKLTISELLDVSKDLIISLKSLSESRHTFSMLVDNDELQLINRKLRVITDNFQKEKVDKAHEHLSQIIKSLRGMNLRVGWSLEHGAKAAAIELNDRVEEIQTKADKLISLEKIYESKLEQIKKLKMEVEAQSSHINRFYAELNKRSAELEKQRQSTQQYEKHLVDFQSDHEASMKKAKQLISEAEQALEVKTADGLSRAFNTKSEEASHWFSNWSWVVIGVLFMGGAAYIGYQLFNIKDLGIAHVIARLSLIPVLLAGAWFSASRYIYQRNLAEDYDYKKVLMSSHVAFSKNLKEGDDDTGEHYRDYIKGFLREIYQHPIKGSSTPPVEERKALLNRDSKKIKQQFDALNQKYEDLAKQLESKSGQLSRIEDIVDELTDTSSN